MTFHDWLSEKLASADMGVLALHRELEARGYQVSSSAVSKWATGKSKPGPAYCEGLALIFKEKPETVLQLAGHRKGEPTSRMPTLEEGIRMIRMAWPMEIPVEGLAAAGYGAPVEVYYYSRRTNGSLRAFEITGDCIPELEPGDRVVIDQEVMPRQGEIIVAEKEGERVIRKYYGDEFRSRHGAEPSVGWQILGTAVEIRRTLRRPRVN